MDRQTALDRLELIRLDGTEFQHPDFAEAFALLETDEEARDTFARRQRQDQGIAQAMQAVPVPDGLRARLNAALANAVEPKADPVTPPTKVNRRWALSALVVLASCIVAAIGVWFWGERPEPLLTLAELLNRAEYDEELLAKLPAFNGNFDPLKPSGLWTSDILFRFKSPAKGMAPNRAGMERVAVYEFYFHDPQGQHPGTLRGVLLVAPRSALADPPESQGFLDGNYTPHPKMQTVAVRTWSEGDLIYVCLVPIEHYEALTEVFNSLVTG